MAAGRLKWDQDGKRTYESGIQNMVLFVQNPDGTYGNGVAWSGVTAFNENPSGAEPTKNYADNSVYGILISPEEFGATLEAFDSPEEFDICDGTAELSTGVSVTAQARRGFALAYRTEIGNDASENYGYKWHIVYGCKASVTARSHATINESPSMNPCSWTINTTPIEVPGFKKTAHIIINSVRVNDEAKMTAFENYLLGKDAVEADPEQEITGSDATPAMLPTPAKLLELFPATEMG